MNLVRFRRNNGDALINPPPTSPAHVAMLHPNKDGDDSAPDIVVTAQPGLASFLRGTATPRPM